MKRIFLICAVLVMPALSDSGTGGDSGEIEDKAEGGLWLHSWCPDTSNCHNMNYQCDRRYTANCYRGRYSRRGAGPHCCCPVCYRKEGVKCNRYRICEPNMRCINGYCRR